jgi:hypothetical protein
MLTSTHDLTATALIGLGSGAKILWQVPDARLGAISRCPSGVYRDKIATGNTATDIKRILDLIQVAARASQNWCGSELRLESTGDG